LLHIVVWHKDLAKIYSITELMSRDDTGARPKPFDLPNEQGEVCRVVSIHLRLQSPLFQTPLFLAVEKRLKEVVAYGLENSDNPNLQAMNRLGDAPLHFAAARGLTDLVLLLCQSSKVDVNLANSIGTYGSAVRSLLDYRAEFSGLTPALCAVKGHMNFLDGTTETVSNKAVLNILLSFGADLTKLVRF